MIAIIDYGMGNLNSVRKALMIAAQRAGLREKITVTSSTRVISEATALVLPGVGAFDTAMDNITKKGFEKLLKERIQQGTPFLGICLGLQLLFETSEEGKSKGLGIINGTVKKFQIPRTYKIPHMGWNTVNSHGCVLFDGIPKNTAFYFVHSYYPIVKDSTVHTITTEYGKPFVSGIFKDNLFAVQFHPEKSQKQGLKLLENFCIMIKKSHI